jgi:hypothetical protein
MMHNNVHNTATRAQLLLAHDQRTRCADTARQQADRGTPAPGSRHTTRAKHFRMTSGPGAQTLLANKLTEELRHQAADTPLEPNTSA